MSTPGETILIQINGETRPIPAGQDLTTFIADLGLSPQTALVEYNGRALLRDEWLDLKLSQGDQLEILRVVAGG